MKYKIVLVPFPFDDLTSLKVRPAVCLTEAIGRYRHVVLAFITSRIPEYFLDSDILIASDAKNFEKTGLRVSSTLRLNRMMTVSASIIRRELGALTKSQQDEVKRKLNILFDLSEVEIPTLSLDKAKKELGLD